MNPSQSTLASAGIGIPAAMLIAWALSLVHVVMPPEIATALGALIGACIGYFGDGGQAAHTIKGMAAASGISQSADSAPPKQGGYARPVLLFGIAMFSMVGFLFASLPGCSALAPAKSFDQQLAYSYGVHTAVLAAAASSVTAKEISGTDGQQVLKLADQSRQILDAARIAELGGDTKTAEGQLQLATNILTELQAYLRSHGK